MCYYVILLRFEHFWSKVRGEGLCDPGLEVGVRGCAAGFGFEVEGLGFDVAGLGFEVNGRIPLPSARKAVVDENLVHFGVARAQVGLCAII